MVTEGEPPKKVQIRQIQKVAKAIRNDADSDAIQLAAAQDFKNRGFMDAYYVSKVNVTSVWEFSDNKNSRFKSCPI